MVPPARRNCVCGSSKPSGWSEMCAAGAGPFACAGLVTKVSDTATRAARPSLRSVPRTGMMLGTGIIGRAYRQLRELLFYCVTDVYPSPVESGHGACFCAAHAGCGRKKEEVDEDSKDTEWFRRGAACMRCQRRGF